MPQLIHRDHKINYQLAGLELGAGGTPVALIHGLGANLAFWYLGAVRHMSDERPIILHDLRGHGNSAMPDGGYGLGQLALDLEYLLADLGAGTVHLVGHSHGARVALAYALAHPERVASLTLADTQIHALQAPMRLRDWPHWPRWKADLARQGVTSFPDEDREIDFELLSALGPRGGGALDGQARRAELAHPPGVRSGISLRSRQMGQRSAAKWSEMLARTSARLELHDESPIDVARLPGVTSPVLLAYGEMTHCLPTSDRLLEILPNARRVIIPGAGHFFPIAKPRVFARVLRMFLASVDGRKGQPPRPPRPRPQRSRAETLLATGRAAGRGEV